MRDVLLDATDTMVDREYDYLAAGLAWTGEDGRYGCGSSATPAGRDDKRADAGPGRR